MDNKSLIKIFITFFKIGLLTIGGGLIMMPIMHNAFVERHKWVNDEKMTEIFSVCQTLPGVIAVNSSVYVGYEIRGIKGAVTAAIGVTLPSFLSILIIFFTLRDIGENIYLAKFYTGVRAAIVGLIAATVIKLCKNSVKDFFGIVIALFGIVATVFFNMDVVAIVVISSFMAYVFYTVRERHFNGA